VRIGSFEHKPSLTIVLMYLLFVALLLTLGTWQMQRAATKTTILAAAATSQSIAAVGLDELGDVLVAATEHKLVTFTGTYHGEQQFLWDNRVHQGQAGFEVITPVRTSAGFVLVNRGWVPPGVTRRDLPEVAISDELRTATVTITGLFSRPSKGFASGDAFDKNEPWPKILGYFDYQMIAQALGSSVIAGVVQPQQKSEAAGAENAGSGGISSEDGNSVGTRADYYTANWEPIASMRPSRHYGYAFQWYAMAAALTILYIVYNTRRTESEQ